MTEALADTDPDPALRAEVGCALPATGEDPWQFLPGGRSNRVWRAGSIVVKSYDPAAASPLFPNDPLAEARVLRHLFPLGIAPRLMAAGDGWIAYAHVPGAVWHGDPAPVAALLQRVHAARADGLGLRMVGSGSAALLAQAAAILATCRDRLPAPGLAEVAPLDAPGLIHGDAVAGNVIVGAEGHMLIDWQCPALGDPAEDLAIFLSPAMQWLYRGRVLSAEEGDAFLSACPPDRARRYRALAPAFRHRMAAHCLWRAERGDADYGTALRMELGR